VCRPQVFAFAAVEEEGLMGVGGTAGRGVYATHVKCSDLRESTEEGGREGGREERKEEGNERVCVREQ